eukprot:scaffold13255_cov128-Isochrysis_galbana.AAC.9
MEVGFNSPSRKRAHFTSTKGNKARKAQGRGERNHIIIIDEVDYRVGAFPYPFRGHEVACRLLQPLSVVGPRTTTPHGTIILPQLGDTPRRAGRTHGSKSYEGKKKAKRRRTPSTIGETDDDVTASSVAT